MTQKEWVDLVKQAVSESAEAMVKALVLFGRSHDEATKIVEAFWAEVFADDSDTTGGAT